MTARWTHDSQKLRCCIRTRAARGTTSLRNVTSAPAFIASFDPLDAILFDLDGVITPTAEVHMHAWRELFLPYAPDYTDADYFAHIDGKPRYDGVRAMLASRGIELPDGDPSDDPSQETVCGLGNRKNDVFNVVLEADGVEPYPGSVAFLDALTAYRRDDGEPVAVAIVSSSKNARPVLEAAGLLDRFEVIVDGVVAAAEGIPGKPNPDTYLYAAQLLGVPADRAIVVEDAHSGVAAGRAGSFGLVLGVDRGAGHEELLANGADVVVDDLGELISSHDD